MISFSFPWPEREFSPAPEKLARVRDNLKSRRELFRLEAEPVPLKDARLPRNESAATTGHPARDGDCEKIRAGISAAARLVNEGDVLNIDLIQVLWSNDSVRLASSVIKS